MTRLFSRYRGGILNRSPDDHCRFGEDGNATAGGAAIGLIGEGVAALALAAHDVKPVSADDLDCWDMARPTGLEPVFPP
jgi:hypothetical protein